MFLCCPMRKINPAKITAYTVYAWFLQVDLTYCKNVFILYLTSSFYTCQVYNLTPLQSSKNIKAERRRRTVMMTLVVMRSGDPPALNKRNPALQVGYIIFEIHVFDLMKEIVYVILGQLHTGLL